MTAACSSSSSSSSAGGSTGSGSSSGSVNWATCGSLSQCGGMTALVAAAKKEGQLNVITLPSNWANYGAIMADFTKQYGIHITDENPDGSSQDELNAIAQLKGQSREPDVVDVGAISKYAPDPAAARLWEEFLYSTAGQNLWLAGEARPIELSTLVSAGTVNQAANAALPSVTNQATLATTAQQASAETIVKQQWSSVGG